MWTVGIETSCRHGSVALLHDEEPVAGRSLSQEGRRHARTLVDELQQMLAEAGLAPQDCDVIAVSRGPGSFTGLRVGIVCAKTWAFATGCRLVGVDTLQAVAEGMPGDVRQVDVIADAQRGDVYVGRYRREDAATWRRQAEVRIVSVEEWLSEASDESVVSGPAVGTFRDRIATQTNLAPETTWIPKAVDVARIGRRQAEAGETSDAWSLEPLYLRKSAAEEKAVRLADGGPGERNAGT